MLLASDSSLRQGYGALGVLLVLHIVVTLFVSQPGYLNADECVYHKMVDHLWAQETFGVSNGYEEHHFAALQWDATVPVKGKLVGQYPEIYTLAAVPFYAALGYRGLFVLNALSFVLALWLFHGSIRRLSDDRGLALAATLILALTTFSWEYSQGSWPHAVTMFISVAAFDRVFVALAEKNAARARRAAVLAGLAIGLGIGVRLDMVFFVPAYLFVLASGPKPRGDTAGALLLGLGPGLVIVALINLAKFDTLSPFSYGPGHEGASTYIGGYLPLAIVGAAGLLALWSLTLPKVRRGLWERPALRWGAIAALAIIIAFTPALWEIFVRIGKGAYQLLVDLRVRDLAIVETAQGRTASGAIVYMGSYKKALLQSSPYLVMAMLPLVLAFRGSPFSRPIFAACLASLSYILPYAYFAWHGGGPSFNLRYFVPILPILSLLVAFAWRHIRDGLPGRWARRARWGRLAVLLAFIPGVPFIQGIGARQEFVLLTLPLVLAGALLALLSAQAYVDETRRTTVRGVLTVVLMAAFTWSGLTAFTYDAQRSIRARIETAAINRTVGEALADDSALVVLDNLHAVCGAWRWKKLRIAEVLREDDELPDVLLRFYLERGTPVYLWALDASVAANRPLLDNFTMTPLLERTVGTLYAVTPAS